MSLPRSEESAESSDRPPFFKGTLTEAIVELDTWMLSVCVDMVGILNKKVAECLNKKVSTLTTMLGAEMKRASDKQVLIV